MSLHSGLYTGTITHERWRPKAHRLSYPIYMMYTDLDELDAIAQQHPLWSVGRRNLSWFKRADYFGDANIPLKTAVLDFMEQRTGYRPSGAVRLLTQWRTWGVGFSPVTFYYLFDADGTTPVAIIPEITNTPWLDRYQYVLTTRPLPGAVMTDGLVDGEWQFSVAKAFHVSPFHPMDHQYHWRFGVPDEQLTMTLQNNDAEGKIFIAWMGLRRLEVNRRNLGLVLRQYPVMTWTVLWGIYSHALRLWFKKVPIFPHPPRGVKK
ncbi:MAG: DUF1365 domain-containing protein [Natronospirillum sp.]